MHRKTLMGLAAGMIVMLAGCGSSGGGSNGGSAGSTSSNSTVSTQQVSSLGTVLTDSNGMTLYFADQDTVGAIKCTAGCTQIWHPLTVSAGQNPTAPSGVSGTLATVKRSDGTTQVTFNGHPLYTFAQDGSAGSASGDMAKDSFGGTSFLWHAAMANGSVSTGGSTGGGGYGGY